MHALHNFVVAGKVLYLGISNTPAWVVSKANEYARQKGLTPFTVYQAQWSCAEREVEREIVSMCIDEGMGICPFGVLAMGYFQTTAQRAAEEKSGEKREGRKVAFVDKPQKTVAADTLETLAIARDVPITSIALAWIRHKAPYVIPILGGRKVEHMEANIKALSIALTQEEIEEIEKAVPIDFGYPSTFLGGAGGARHPGDVWPTKRFGNFDWNPPVQVSGYYWSCIVNNLPFAHSISRRNRILSRQKARLAETTCHGRSKWNEGSDFTSPIP